MDNYGFHDGNIYNLLESRYLDVRPDVDRSLQMHSSLIRRLSQERELEVTWMHQGCVNSIAWNSKGSLLISGSDDIRVNIWSYTGRKLLLSIDTGHSANIFCTKLVPETSDELVVSGAGDAEVCLFNFSHLSGRGPDDNSIAPSALYQCHTRRVKTLAVEVGNPNVVWSASEDGTLRQHDFREGAACPPGGSYPHECRNILLDLQSGAKRSLADPPKQTLALKSCDISTSRPHLLLVGGSDAFARLYDRRMLPPLTSHRKRMNPPPCANYFCPMHLSEHVRSSSLHLTHVTFSPNGDEVLLSYSGEHVYLMNVNYRLRRLCLYYEVSCVDFEVKTILASDMIYNLIDGGRDLSGGTAVRYTMGDASKLMTIGPTYTQWSRAATTIILLVFLGKEIASMDVEYHHCLVNGALFDHNENDTLKDSRLLYVFVGDSYSGNALCVRFEECCDPFLLEKLIRHPAIFLRSSLVLCVQTGDYVASGSDDGRWFVWEKQTGRLIKMLLGDEAVVNCVQCHPFDCVVATSGIDSTIKIWSPSASVPSIVAWGAAGPEICNVLEAMESNQRRLCHNREAILPFELLERFRMHEFTEGTLHPFECAQS
eukprot:XP_024449800.1 WD and tetratricopeptide repeats protein 1 [Populus trichocarpa]